MRANLSMLQVAPKVCWSWPNLATRIGFRTAPLGVAVEGNFSDVGRFFDWTFGPACGSRLAPKGRRLRPVVPLRSCRATSWLSSQEDAVKTKKSIVIKVLFEIQRVTAKRSETPRTKILWRSRRSKMNFPIGRRVSTFNTMMVIRSALIGFRSP